MDKTTFKHECARVSIINPTNYLCKQYEKGLSTQEISEKLLNNYGISISSRAIAQKLKGNIEIRTRSERRLNAIKRKRVVRTVKCEHCGCKTRV